MTKNRKMLVTNALPYANGSLHLGHMVGYIQADIWVRLHKMLGADCKYICGSDCHGTPIMIQAEKKGLTPEKMIADMTAEHAKDFADFQIKFDQYYTTHSKENEELIHMIFKRHLEADNIHKKIIKQLFDPEKKMFLPDRYIKGTCPRCKAEDQYGDNCEKCGASYTPTELIDPVSALSGAKPIEKETEHYFFDLQKFESYLKEWTRKGHLQSEVANKLDEWFEAGLREWDITRDSPYFGFKIPGEDDKYFYVWLDAPIGYIASFKKYCEENPAINFEEYWGENSDVELYHFIGKDIIYFHALFWPAVLHGAKLRTPNAIYANGFLTIDGQKMSKSRGTFIQARTYLQHLSPTFLRYYFAAKLTDRIEDLDINFDDFILRINSDLVGKFINIASRCARFIGQSYDNKLSDKLSDDTLFNEFAKAGDSIAENLKNLEYSHAVREIMALADRANQYIDEQKPWVMIKDDSKKDETHAVCTLGLNLFRQLMIYLKPILPETAEEIERFLNIEPLMWGDKDKPLLNHSINRFEPILKRIDPKNIEALKMDAQKDIAESSKAPKETPEKKETESNGVISIDDFAKLDLRVAKIVEANYVEGADKLLSLKVDIGDETRQVFAGIRAAYEPEKIIGKHVVVVANLAPRKMRFGVSEGMVLCAGPGGEDLWIISPEDGAQPGMKVK